VAVRADVLARVKEFVAADKYSVRFVLSAPLAPLPFILAQEGSQPVIHPKEVIENAPAGRLPSYVGTGPYKLTEWVQDQQVVLERFKDYSARTDEKKGLAGKKVAYFDKIIFKSVPEAEVRLAGLRTGQFDAAAPLPQEYLPQLQKMEGVTPLIIKFDMKPVVYFSFAENSALKNVLMRKALRAALNMDEIMFAATGSKDFYELDHDMFFRFQALWSEVGKEAYNTHDTALAKRLAAEAGYKGEPIRFLASATQFHHRRPAIMIVEQLRSAGFNIHLDLRDWATVAKMQMEPDKWDMAYTRTVMYFPAEVDLVKYMGFDSPEMQKVLDVVAQETDLNRLKAAFDVFRKDVLVEQVPWILMGDMFALYGVRNHVKNLQPIYTHPLWNVWFEARP
jgi:peptide/nickel transport system substrate-binding protein